jgi:hypothetical protein
MKCILLIFSVLLCGIELQAQDRRRAIMRAVRNPASLTSSGAWQNTVDPSVLTFSVGTSSGNGQAVKIVANSSGTVTKLRWHFAGRLTSTIKLALYSDAAGSPNAPLVSGSAVSPVNDDSPGYIEVTGLSQAVVSGTTYWIAIAHADNALTYSYNPLGGARVYHLGTEDISLFPKNPYAADGADAVQFAAGMFK